MAHRDPVGINPEVSTPEFGKRLPPNINPPWQLLGLLHWMHDLPCSMMWCIWTPISVKIHMILSGRMAFLPSNPERRHNWWQCPCANHSWGSDLWLAISDWLQVGLPTGAEVNLHYAWNYSYLQSCQGPSPNLKHYWCNAVIYQITCKNVPV